MAGADYSLMHVPQIWRLVINNPAEMGVTKSVTLVNSKQ